MHSLSLDSTTSGSSGSSGDEDLEEEVVGEMEAPMVKTEAPRNDVINISTDEEEARCEWGLASCLLFFFLLCVPADGCSREFAEAPTPCVYK